MLRLYPSASVVEVDRTSRAGRHVQPAAQDRPFQQNDASPHRSTANVRCSAQRRPVATSPGVRQQLDAPQGRGPGHHAPGPWVAGGGTAVEHRLEREVAVDVGEDAQPAQTHCAMARKGRTLGRARPSRPGGWTASGRPLLSLLQFQRDSMVRKVEGVSDEDARRSPVTSGTTLLWLVKHLCFAESIWVERRFAGLDVTLSGDTVEVEADTLEAAVAAYRDTWARVGRHRRRSGPGRPCPDAGPTPAPPTWLGAGPPPGGDRPPTRGTPTSCGR